MEGGGVGLRRPPLNHESGFHPVFRPIRPISPDSRCVPGRSAPLPHISAFTKRKTRLLMKGQHVTASMATEKIVNAGRTPNCKVSVPVKFDVNFLEQCDARKRAVRLMKKRYLTLREHTGAEGTAQKEILVRRATFLSLYLESLEIQAMSGAEVNMSTYSALSNSLTGLLKALGISKHMKSAVSVTEYLAEQEKKTPKSKWASECEAADEEEASPI